MQEFTPRQRFVFRAAVLAIIVIVLLLLGVLRPGRGPVVHSAAQNGPVNAPDHAS